MIFKIGGEFLPGKGEKVLKRTPKTGPDGKTQLDRDGKEVMEEKLAPANELEIVPIDDHILPIGKNAQEIVRVRQVFDMRTVPIKRIDTVALWQTRTR